MYLSFVDWKKAFGRVNHERLFNEIGINSKDLWLILALYYEQIANAKISNNVTGETQIKKGVPQGCVLSSELFNLYSESILRDINHLSAYDEISRHGKPPLAVSMTRYLVMAGSHNVVLDRCGILILWE